MKSSVREEIIDHDAKGVSAPEPAFRWGGETKCFCERPTPGPGAADARAAEWGKCGPSPYSEKRCFANLGDQHTPITIICSQPKGDVVG